MLFRINKSINLSSQKCLFIGNAFSMNVARNLITSTSRLYSEDNSFVSKMLVFPYKRSVQEPIEDSMTIIANSGNTGSIWQL